MSYCDFCVDIWPLICWYLQTKEGNRGEGESLTDCCENPYRLNLLDIVFIKQHTAGYLEFELTTFQIFFTYGKCDFPLV